MRTLNSICSGAKVREKLEKEKLGEFFKVEELHIERKTRARTPLAKLYKAIISENKKGRELESRINALSLQDQNLFYEIIVVSAKNFHRSIAFSNFKDNLDE